MESKFGKIESNNSSNNTNILNQGTIGNMSFPKGKNKFMQKHGFTLSWVVGIVFTIFLSIIFYK